jgi:hypothetical protein
VTSVNRKSVIIGSKPWLSLGGILSAAMGIATAEGLLSLIGVPFIQIAMITPFLVLCKCLYHFRDYN